MTARCHPDTTGSARAHAQICVIHIIMYTYTQTHTTGLCIHTRTYLPVYTYPYIHTRIQYIHLHTYKHLLAYTRMHIHTGTYAQKQPFLHTKNICTGIHAQKHTHIYIHMHKNTYTWTYTYANIYRQTYSIFAWIHTNKQTPHTRARINSVGSVALHKHIPLPQKTFNHSCYSMKKRQLWSHTDQVMVVPPQRR